MIERHLAKLRARDDISLEEENAIRGAVADYREYPADLEVIRAGQTIDASTLLLSGFMCRYKDLKSGARQITELHVAGDFVDLHSFTLKRLDHSIGTLTPCTVGMVPHEKLQEITEKLPHLTRVFWFATNLDAAIHREWELSLGRRTATQRMAHLICELNVRLGLVGLSVGGQYDLPLTQNEMAEALGLTSVHVNRTLQQLRENGVVEFRGGRVSIFDLEELQRMAEFDPSYLYLEKRSR
jgi:CRP-like cAMP-binding protein